MKWINNNRVFEHSVNIKKEQNTVCENLAFFYPSLRQGLFQLLKTLDKKTVLLPSYCPEGIIDPFIKLGYIIAYYEVDKNGNLEADFNLGEFDIFVYIHYYGLYNSQNIKIIKNKLENNHTTLFIEDFAHTIFTSNLIFTGNYCTFSFTKMLGVYEGSCILFNQIEIPRAVYTKNTFNSKKLKISCGLHFVKQSFIKNPYFIRGLDFFLFSIGLYNSYKMLMNSYTTVFPKIGSYSTKIIKTIDFDKISMQRQRYAEIYLQQLHPDLLFDIPKEYYTRQALFAFPILVENREIFAKDLAEKGVGSLNLSNRWWFGSLPQNDLCKSHLLLPINHNLTESDIYKIIEEVNTLYSVHKLVK